MDIPVAIRAVGIHIHVGDDKKGSAGSHWILQLEHRLAVVEIVAREHGVEVGELAVEVVCFEFVDFFEKRRHRGSGQENGEVFENGW